MKQNEKGPGAREKHKRQYMRDPGKIRYMWKPVSHVF